MAPALQDWVSPSLAAWVKHPDTDADWESLLEEYGGAALEGSPDAKRPEPLRRIFGLVRDQGCRTVVIENRYIDLDWRSEYSVFWSRRFELPPPFTRRLHFFTEIIADDQIHSLPEAPGYLGYCVIRPIPWGPVGRTVITPPHNMRDGKAVLATVRDPVSLFGNDLVAEGVAFCQQDTQYLVCAHTSVWIAHYTAYRRGLVGRRSTADLFEMVPKHLSHKRTHPSGGVSLLQMQAVFGGLEQPAIFYGIKNLPTPFGTKPPQAPLDPDTLKPKPAGLWDERIFSVICRYLSSGFPVIVAGEEHALTLVGWRRDGEEIRFIACDDQVGPYEEIDSPFTHYRAPWHSIFVPLPPRVLVAGEAAESFVGAELRGWGRWGEANGDEHTVSLAHDAEHSPDTRLECYLMANADYKRLVAQQGRDPSVVRQLRLARLPHWVWVLEVQDVGRRQRGQPCVRAEFVCDTSSHDRSPRIATRTLPGGVMTSPPDGGPIETAPHDTPYWTSIADVREASGPFAAGTAPR